MRCKVKGSSWRICRIKPHNALQKAVVIQPKVIENKNSNTASSVVILLAARILNMMPTPVTVVAITSSRKPQRRADAQGSWIVFSGCCWTSIGVGDAPVNLLNGIGIPDITPYLTQALAAQFDGQPHVYKIVSFWLKFKRDAPGFLVRQTHHHQVSDRAGVFFQISFQRHIG